MTLSERGVDFGQLRSFVNSCDAGSSNYKLTPFADATPYARCFAVFILKLLRDPGLPQLEEPLTKAILEDIEKVRRHKDVEIQGKPYRQLLTFSLSALAGMPSASPKLLDELVAEQLPFCGIKDLERLGCLSGRPGSGNQAMFMAIFLLHAKDHLAADTGPQIEAWVEVHLRSMNRFGFWGGFYGMTHLQFQNGYHQHEVLEYLALDNPHLKQTLAAVRGLADHEGHFAPYPGGGGCYDYDAVFMLTPHGHIPDEATRRVLERTASSLLAEQNPDGGFCESLQVRPRSVAQLAGFIRHAWAARGNPEALRERLRYGLTLQRPKHNRIHTHWSRYSRGWNESDLWDSWFRMLALARIDVAMHPEHAGHWGFIDYPGIGYHPSLRTGKVAR
jgi:hypothetical protein